MFVSGTIPFQRFSYTLRSRKFRVTVTGNMEPTVGHLVCSRRDKGLWDLYTTDWVREWCANTSRLFTSLTAKSLQQHYHKNTGTTRHRVYWLPRFITILCNKVEGQKCLKLSLVDDINRISEWKKYLSLPRLSFLLVRLKLCLNTGLRRRSVHQTFVTLHDIFYRHAQSKSFATPGNYY